MRSLLPLFAVGLLAAVTWSASFFGNSPVATEAGRRDGPKAAADNSRPPAPPAAVAVKVVTAKIVTAKIVTAKIVTAKIVTAKIVTAKIVTVKIDNFAFEPATLTVARGTTVEWINRDDVPHTVVDKKVRFKSTALDTDDRYRHTFSEPGRYAYFCSIHPHMLGEIHVTP
jgi:plastocyanin